MQAAYIAHLGPPAAIRFGALPAPAAGPTDVPVDVLATTVNPVDTFIRSGTYRTSLTFPFVVGRDLVGRVAETRPGFAVGDLVWCDSMGHDGRQGAAAERVVVPADRLYRLPDGVAPEEAVTVLHPAATAHLALFVHGRLRTGEVVLVQGAAGNVGSALVTMAAEAGAHVIATAAARDADHCRGLGAAEVFDYQRPLPERADVDVAVDTSGRNDLPRVLPLLAERGRIVLLAGMRSRPELPAAEVFLRSASVHGFVISRATVDELAGAARTVNRLLARGRLRSRRTEVVPLSATAEAHARLEGGDLRGRRVVIRVGD